MSWVNFFSRRKLSGDKDGGAKKFGWKRLLQFSELNERFYESLEEQLFEADVGGRNAVELVAEFRERIGVEKVKSREGAIALLRGVLGGYFIENTFGFSDIGKKVKVITLIGVNGAGKTTTVAKLASFLKREGGAKFLVLGAADTFRAAAAEQLSVWGDRLGVEVVKKESGSDASAVAYEAVQRAIFLSRKLKGEGDYGVCLLDTAGRLQNKLPLLEQLNKLMRVVAKFGGEVEEKRLLVLDATLGQNGYEQARVFKEKVGIDGLVLTKTDTQARGGVVIGISKSLRLPLYFITYGEGLDAISFFRVDEYLSSFI